MRTDAKGKMDVLSGRVEGGGLRESCSAEAPAMRDREGCQEGGWGETGETKIEERCRARVTSSESAIESVSRPFRERVAAVGRVVLDCRVSRHLRHLRQLRQLLFAAA